MINKILIQRLANNKQYQSAFTLIELLVVITIITILIAILLPALSSARTAAKATQCMSNLHQMGIGEYAYANDHDGYMPLAHDPSKAYSPTHGAGWFWYRGPWVYSLLPYVGLKQPKNTLTSFEGRQLLGGGLFHCPANPNWNLHSTHGPNYVSYGQNQFNPGWGTVSKKKRIAQVRYPSRLLLICDTASGSFEIDNSSHKWKSSAPTVSGTSSISFWHPNNTNNVLCVDGHVIVAQKSAMVAYHSTNPDGKLLLKHP